MIFALNEQLLECLLQMCVGLPDFYSRNPREIFLYMQLLCQISDMSQLLQIYCECTDCTATRQRIAVYYSPGRCFGQAHWPQTHSHCLKCHKLPDKPSQSADAPPAICLISRNARKNSQTLLFLLGHKLQKGKEGMVVKKLLYKQAYREQK